MEDIIKKISQTPKGEEFLRLIDHQNQDEINCVQMLYQYDGALEIDMYTSQKIKIPWKMNNFVGEYINYLEKLDNCEFYRIGVGKEFGKLWIREKNIVSIDTIHTDGYIQFRNRRLMFPDTCCTFLSIKIQHKRDISRLETKIDKLTSFMEAHLAFMPEGEYTEAVKEDWKQLVNAE